MEDNQHTCVVTFAEDVDQDSEVFHIFDDDNNENSGREDSARNSPPTVRERQTGGAESLSPERPSTAGRTSSTDKSSENTANVIENSIYCAKTKDLRLKINDEIISMITALDRRDIFSMERDEIMRVIKRSGEFCTRFNRIYMYQLQRQMHDIKRNNNLMLPFAKHTQFQSQMVRIVSLHQNLLQSFQVFHKSLEQTWCVRESVSALGALVGAARAASAHCAAVRQPKHLAHANVYDDDLLKSCDKLEQFVNEYTLRCEEFLNGFSKMRKSGKKSTKHKTKKRAIHSKKTTQMEADARLSMYSLDTLRLNTKSPSSKDALSNVTKSRGTLNTASHSKVASPANEEPPASPPPKKKSPRSGRSRRPLMRDPHAARGRAPRQPRPLKDNEIRTMVEAVEACTSSHISPEDSPHMNTYMAQFRTKINVSSPRPHVEHAPITKKSQIATPRKSPKGIQNHSPKPLNLKSTLSCIQSVSQDLLLTQTTAVCKITSKKKKPTREVREKEIEDIDGDNSKDSITAESPRTLTPKSPITPVSPIPPLPMMAPNSPVPDALSPQNPLSPVQPIAPISPEREEKRDRKTSSRFPDQCEVTRLLKQLCSGDSTADRQEHKSGAKNAQLLYVRGSSPRSQPTTPQLLRILEETIQKKVPKSLHRHRHTDVERYRLTFNIAEQITDNLFQYRTKFVQHMLTSPMYANSAVGKPWEMIGSVSEQIIDEVLLKCVKEMELKDIFQDMYNRETTVPN
ncbi:uncharacterized protein LOC142977537 isoform X2 [Anticarsia gemmatalis]